MFWGIAIIAIGTIVLLNAMFGLNLPAIRILVGIFIVFLGLKVIFGSSWRHGHHHEGWSKSGGGSFVFSSGESKPKSMSELEEGEFNVVFGSGTLDLTDLEDYSTGLSVNTVFAQTVIILPGDVALAPKINSVMGSVELPEEAQGTGEKKLDIRVNTVFGSTKFIRQKQ